MLLVLFIKGDKIFFKNLLSSTGSFTPLWRSSATKGYIIISLRLQIGLKRK